LADLISDLMAESGVSRWKVVCGAVQGQVVLAAEPTDIEGLGIVVVVGLGVLVTAYLAWLGDEGAALDVNVGVGAAVHLLALVWCQGVVGPPCSDVGGVAIVAVALAGAGWHSAFTGEGEAAAHKKRPRCLRHAGQGTRFEQPSFGSGVRLPEAEIVVVE
jgi:apolipoprotein N-acyltransferase